MEMEMENFKTCAYTPFTESYGVMMSGFNQVFYRHDTMDDAKMKANELNRKYKPKNTDNLTYWVKELEIDECDLSALKRIAWREDVNICNKSKKKLKEILKPIIEHKKHLNRYQETDFESCDLCISGKAEEYKKNQEKRDKNPLIIKSRAINKMYRKTMFDAINESEVTKQYGFSHDDLEKAVIAQKIHFQRRSFFGNSYIRYERNEVIKYYNQYQKEEKEKEEKEKGKKRKLEELDGIENEKEIIPHKKIKIDQVNHDNDDDIEKKCDYKGVPEIFRSFKWLYTDCDELTDNGRNKIVRFMKGEYNKNDVENEDVLIKRVETNDGKQKSVKDTVFRMLFREKKWKKVAITKKIKIR